MDMKNYFWMTSCLFLLFFAGCTSDNIAINDSLNAKELSDIRKQTLHLAHRVGIPAEQAERSSTKELLSDIESKLNGSHEYIGSTLSDDELKLLTVYLNNKRDILNTIEQYHRYIQNSRTQRIIAIPKRDE